MSQSATHPALHASGDSLEQFAKRKLAALGKRDMRRTLTVTQRRDNALATLGGVDFVSFACNDYLGLSRHPDVIEAAVEATRQYGAGAGASRLISGNHPLYRNLEDGLRRLKQTEDAIVFGSGYLANTGIIPALAGLRDLVLIDEHCHSSLISGARLSRAQTVEFRHNDLEHLRQLLGARRGAHRRCLILTDGVFSMEGDIAPLHEISELAREFDAWLMSDDAHGLGVVGGGRGSAFVTDPPAQVPLQMGTLSKAVGAYGGYLCASNAVCEYLRNRARSFVYSTGLPPGTVAAATRALEIISSDSTLVERPLAHARRFTQALDMAPAESPIVPVLLGTNEKALAASAMLAEAGFLVPAIRPPTVPLGTARLRFAFAAAHDESQVLEAARIVQGLL